MMTQPGTSAVSGTTGCSALPHDLIPVIDIAPLASTKGAAYRRTVDEITRACREIGFFYVRNHGVPEPLITRACELARAFHHSPLEQRLEVHVRNSPGTRGWDPSILDYDDPDPELYRIFEPVPEVDDYLLRKKLHSSFDISIEIADDDPDYVGGNIMLVPNQWPGWIPGFRDDILAYYAAMSEVGSRLFRAFSDGLCLPRDFFPSRTRKPPSQLRLLHYPENDLPTDRAHLGIASHSDFECFTVLYQTGSGLQVMNAEDEWLDAPPLDGTFVVNVGDLLEGWSNGYFRSTPHRVVNTGNERFSLPMFFSVDYDTVVEPLPRFVSAERPARYGRIVAGQHLANFSIYGAKHLRRRIVIGDLVIPFDVIGTNPFRRSALDEI